MRRRWSGVLAVLAVAAVGCGADDEPDEGAAGLEELLTELDPDGPGCVVGLSDPAGRSVVARGLADIEAGEELDASTVFDIGSVSKQFTGGAIALLVLDGRLDLDDDAAVAAGIPPFDPVVTVADLVHMSSGLPDYIGLLDAEDSDVTTMDDALAVLASDEIGPEFDPGSEFEYSNSNYVLLSAIVETRTGESLPSFSDERIFGPLGMTSAVVRDDQGKLLPAQAQGYADADGDWEPVGSSWRQTGDGAVHTTVPDLLGWGELFVDGGERADANDVGGRAWLELMVSPGPVADDDGSEYGFGIGVEDGGEVLAHSGSWIGYSSALVVVPAAEVVAAVSCNIDGFDAEGLARTAAARAAADG